MYGKILGGAARLVSGHLGIPTLPSNLSDLSPVGRLRQRWHAYQEARDAQERAREQQQQAEQEAEAGTVLDQPTLAGLEPGVGAAPMPVDPAAAGPGIDPADQDSWFEWLHGLLDAER